jgi:hypothetical protein
MIFSDISENRHRLNSPATGELSSAAKKGAIKKAPGDKKTSRSLFTYEPDAF